MARRVPSRLLFATTVALVVTTMRVGSQGAPPQGVSPQDPPTPQLSIGTFVAARIDAERLPVSDRVVDDDGTLYVIEFDRMVLSLAANRTFRASVRYRRTLFANDPRGRVRPTPLQSMTVTGTYELARNEIRFHPDSSSGAGSVRMLAGTVANARELSIPFHYRNGTQERQRTLLMQRRDNLF
jgi:hypothetical protein